jgi:hypothetical protein
MPLQNFTLKSTAGEADAKLMATRKRAKKQKKSLVEIIFILNENYWKLPNFYRIFVKKFRKLKIF